VPLHIINNLLLDCGHPGGKLEPRLVTWSSQLAVNAGGVKLPPNQFGVIVGGRCLGVPRVLLRRSI